MNAASYASLPNVAIKRSGSLLKEISSPAISKESLSTPYWWWADLADSYDYLDELACSEDNSTIRGRADWEANIWKAVEYFELKHGYKPAFDKPVPDLSFDDVSSILKTITTNND